jgi:IclR family pca regulon transcriptional regulator
MGRVLLAALPDAALNAFIRKVKLVRLTQRSVTDRNELKQRILEVRNLGHCYIEGEVDDRIAGLATPIKDEQGKTIAALNLSLGSGRHDRSQAEAEFLPLLKEAAQKIEQVVQSGVPLA